MSICFILHGYFPGGQDNILPGVSRVLVSGGTIGCYVRRRILKIHEIISRPYLTISAQADIFCVYAVGRGLLSRLDPDGDIQKANT